MTEPIYPVLAEEYTFRYSTDGITLNSALNVPTVGSPIWDVQKVTGLDLPEVKMAGKEFDGSDGGVLNAENIKMRTITIEGALIAHPDDSLEVYLDLLKTNYAPMPRDSTHLPGDIVDRNVRPFYFKAPGIDERFIFAKSVGLHYEWGGERRYNSAPFLLVLQAEDPTFFSPQLHSMTVAAEQDFVIWYYGNCPGIITATIIGACTFPSIDHTESDRTLSFNSTLTAGQSAVIDFKSRTAIRNPGSTSIRGQVFVEDWWRLRQGANTIRLNVGSGTPTIKIAWRDGWY